MNSDTLVSLLTPVVAGVGLELDGLEVIPVGRRNLVRITLDGDGPGGSGPTLDEIADATRLISAALDTSSATGDAPYTLEVSSRGVSKPLTEARHWRRNAGRLVSVTTVSGEAVTGRILAMDGDAVRLELPAGERSLPLAEVRKAVVQIEFNRPAPELETGADWDTEEE